MTIDIAFIVEALREISKVIPLTLFMTMTPILLGIVIGIIVAFVRIQQIKIVSSVLNFYVSFLEEHLSLCISCSFILACQF